MNDYPDNELIEMVNECNEDASDMLYKRYKFIVTSVLRKFTAKAKKVGIDYRELKQEALVGFSDALANFDQDKDTSLNTFITLCVERRVNNYVRKMESNKEKLNKEHLSLDLKVDEDHLSLYETIGDHKLDPASILENDEETHSIVKKAALLLSDSEIEVLKLLLEEYSYQDIADILDVPIKSVYNKIQRIRSKLKN